MRIKPDSYLKNLTCLYVEDDEEVKESFLIIINKIFKKVYVANNGKEALRIYSEYTPDIVLSDIKMPEIDGLELTKAIKNINKNSYIILLTAFSDMEYLKKAIDLGVEGYITKPVDKKKLYEKLNFFANIIKHQKESEENLKLLQKLIESKNFPVLLTKDNEIKLKNRTFINEFGNFDTLDDLEDFLQIDLYFDNQPQTVTINGKKYNIIYEEADDINKIIKFEPYQNIHFLDIRDKDSKALKSAVLDKLNCYIIINTCNESIKQTIRQNLRKNDILIQTDKNIIVIPHEVNSKPVAEKIARNLRDILKNRNDDVEISTKCLKITDIQELNEL